MRLLSAYFAHVSRILFELLLPCAYEATMRHVIIIVDAIFHYSADFADDISLDDDIYSRRAERRCNIAGSRRLSTLLDLGLAFAGFYYRAATYDFTLPPVVSA